jgi:hypothetical protein
MPQKVNRNVRAFGGLPGCQIASGVGFCQAASGMFL